MEGVTLSFPSPREAGRGCPSEARAGEGLLAARALSPPLRGLPLPQAGEGKEGESRAYFFNTLTGLPASHALMSSTICV